MGVCRRISSIGYFEVLFEEGAYEPDWGDARDVLSNFCAMPGLMAMTKGRELRNREGSKGKRGDEDG